MTAAPEPMRGPERERGESLRDTTGRNPPLTRRTTPEAGPEGKASGAPLWIGVGVVFALMALAWTAMFFFASKYRADDVRTPTKEAR